MKELNRFLKEAGDSIHALELNGLRHARENKEVSRMARETGRLIISGGDRHGLEPNANVNLTSASSFTEFVEEIRIHKFSHVHFMPQYRENWEQRLMRSTVEAVTDFPEFMPGWQKWDERAFHPDQSGVLRPMAELWSTGRPPVFLQACLHLTRFLCKRSMSKPLAAALSRVNRVNDVSPEMNWVTEVA